MFFGEIRTVLRRMCGNITTTNVSDTILNTLLNESIRMISLEYRFRENRRLASFPTTVGVARYQLPSDLSYLRQVWDDTHKRRLAGPYGEFTLSKLPVRSNGWPVRYIRDRNWIQLDPPPSEVITLTFVYTAVHQDITSDVEQPSLPLDWHYALALHARWLYYTEIQDFPKAQNSLNTFNLWVSRHPTPVEKEMDEADMPADFPELSGESLPVSLGFDYVE